jgi:glycosyltransferase involved in cell wall biosynthesis
MALGRPVISTMINGIPELVKSGTNGLLCPAADLTSLVEAIKTMNNYSDKEINSMGNKAKQSVCERHDINIEAKKLAELFKSHEGIS